MINKKEDYRIIFFGTPEFAVKSLQKLYESEFNIVAVVTVADKKAGRGRKLQESDVKKYALENNLKILQPTNLKSSEFINELTALSPDIQIVVAFRMLPDVVIKIPKDGTVNLHASLLPQYRGAAPINHVLIQGEKKTGATTFLIDSKIDTGEILYQKEIEITDNDTAGKLHDKLMYAGANLLNDTVEKIMLDQAKSTPQSELIKTQELKKAKKIFTNDCYINFNQSTDKVYNFIRGLTPYPASRFILKHKEENKSVICQVIDSEPEYLKHNHQTGILISENRKQLKVTCINGFILIKNIKPQGKKAMDISSFLNGFQTNDYFIE